MNSDSVKILCVMGDSFTHCKDWPANDDDDSVSDLTSKAKKIPPRSPAHPSATNVAPISTPPPPHPSHPHPPPSLVTTPPSLRPSSCIPPFVEVFSLINKPIYLVRNPIYFDVTLFIQRTSQFDVTQFFPRLLLPTQCFGISNIS